MSRAKGSSNRKIIISKDHRQQKVGERAKAISTAKQADAPKDAGAQDIQQPKFQFVNKPSSSPAKAAEGSASKEKKIKQKILIRPKLQLERKNFVRLNQEAYGYKLSPVREATHELLEPIAAKLATKDIHIDIMAVNTMASQLVTKRGDKQKLLRGPHISQSIYLLADSRSQVLKIAVHGQPAPLRVCIE